MKVEVSLESLIQVFTCRSHHIYPCIPGSIGSLPFTNYNNCF